MQAREVDETEGDEDEEENGHRGAASRADARHAMRSGTKRKSLSKNNREEARGTEREGGREVPEVADFVHNYNAEDIEVHRHDMIMIGQHGLLMNMRMCAPHLGGSPRMRIRILEGDGAG